MATIRIVVSAVATIPPQPDHCFQEPHQELPLGYEVPFTDDLVLKQYDGKTPGNGLPKDQKDRFAGTHSGFVNLGAPGDGVRGQLNIGEVIYSRREICGAPAATAAHRNHPNAHAISREHPNKPKPAATP
jgi:hypothetical protein